MPTSRIILSMITLVGAGIGLAFATGCAGALSVMILDAGNDLVHPAPLIFTAFWLALLAGYGTAMGGWIHAHHRLPTPQRRSIKHFLTLGLLAGGLLGWVISTVIVLLSL